MKRFFGSIVLLTLFLSIWYSYSYAAINYTLTPIRYELEMQPWESRTLPASIRNNGTETVTLPTAKSDFESTGAGGVPRLIRKSELVFPDQELSSWITLSQTSVTAAPGQEATMDFTIDVPTTATPGWHYGAVIFNNPNSETSAGGNIGINVDYGILILVNVAWEVIVDAEVWTPSVGWSTGQWNGNGWFTWIDENGNPIYIYPDICPLWDFTTSKFDWKCVSLPFTPVNPDTSTPDDLNVSENVFGIDFSIPIKNKWNTHIKPRGEIVLVDDAGNVIKWIGKITIENERGAVIGSEVVDYLPINDEWGNILPKTDRVFVTEWKWFPYKTYDERGEPTIEYWSPGEYYTNQNKSDNGFVMFWQRVSEVRQNKNIIANIKLTYDDQDGNPIEFNAAKEFPVQYIEQKITTNPYIILWLVLLLAAWVMILWALRWWFAAVHKRKCWKCKEAIKPQWETCPYCKTIQNKREHKKFEKVSKK